MDALQWGAAPAGARGLSWSSTAGRAAAAAQPELLGRGQMMWSTTLYAFYLFIYSFIFGHVHLWGFLEHNCFVVDKCIKRVHSQSNTAAFYGSLLKLDYPEASGVFAPEIDHNRILTSFPFFSVLKCLYFIYGLLLKWGKKKIWLLLSKIFIFIHDIDYNVI